VRSILLRWQLAQPACASIWMRQVFSKVYMLQEGVGNRAAHRQQAVVAQHQEVGLLPRSACRRGFSSSRKATPS
jgi:hypothetical protein